MRPVTQAAMVGAMPAGPAEPSQHWLLALPAWELVSPQMLKRFSISFDSNHCFLSERNLHFLYVCKRFL